MRTGLLLFFFFFLNSFQLSNQKLMLKSVVDDRPPRPRVTIDISSASIADDDQPEVGVHSKVPFFINNKQNLTWKIDL